MKRRSLIDRLLRRKRPVNLTTDDMDQIALEVVRKMTPALVQTMRDIRRARELPT